MGLIVLLLDDGYQLVAQKKFHALLRSNNKMECVRFEYSSPACERKKRLNENALRKLHYSDYLCHKPDDKHKLGWAALNVN